MNKIRTYLSVKRIVFLIIIFVIGYNVQAKDVYIGVGLNTTHVKYDKFKDDYDFNENNDLLAVEIVDNKDSYTIMKFKNSFYKDSLGLQYSKKVFENKRLNLLMGLSIVGGYGRDCVLKSKTEENCYYYFNNNLVIGGLMFLPTVGININITKDFQLNTTLFGNAIITTLKYKID